jgi:hypothetical protein
MFKTILSFGLLVIASYAFAHETKGLHGGRVVDAGEYHVELVVKQRAIEIYVRDHADKPVATTGFKGLAIFAAGGKSHRIALEPDPAGKLTGQAPVDLPATTKGVVQITPANGKTVSGRFN